MILLEKNKNGTGLRPANLFFIELIIILLFFTFSAAVILSVFASADYRQRKSDLIEKAVICSQSIAEAFSVTGDFTEATDMVFGESGGIFNGNTAQILLDNEMQPCDDGEIVLYMIQNHRETKAGTLSSLEFDFSTKEGKLFPSVICSSYSSDKGGAADE